MAATEPDRIAVAHAFLDAMFCKDGPRSLITADFLHFRNVGEVSLDAPSAQADLGRLRGCCHAVTITHPRSLLTKQGVICEPRIVGETIAREPFLLLPMHYIQISNDGLVYRIDEYLDSAALAPLIAAGYEPAAGQ